MCLRPPHPPPHTHTHPAHPPTHPPTLALTAIFAFTTNLLQPQTILQAHHDPVRRRQHPRPLWPQGLAHHGPEEPHLQARPLRGPPQRLVGPSRQGQGPCRRPWGQEEEETGGRLRLAARQGGGGAAPHPHAPPPRSTRGRGAVGRAGIAPLISLACPSCVLLLLLPAARITLLPRHCLALFPAVFASPRLWRPPLPAWPPPYGLLLPAVPPVFVAVAPPPVLSPSFSLLTALESVMLFTCLTAVWGDLPTLESGGVERCSCQCDACDAHVLCNPTGGPGRVPTRCSRKGPADARPGWHQPVPLDTSSGAGLSSTVRDDDWWQKDTS